jgi:chromosome segregation ATPase
MNFDVPYLTEILSLLLGGGLVKAIEAYGTLRQARTDERRLEHEELLGNAQAIQQITEAATQAVALVQAQVERQGVELTHLRDTVAQQQVTISGLQVRIGSHQELIRSLERKVDHYRTGVTLLSKQVLELGAGPVFVLHEKEDLDGPAT